MDMVYGENIAKTIELNPRILSILNHSKYILSMKPGGGVDTKIVRPLVISVALVNRNIGNFYSKSG